MATATTVRDAGVLKRDVIDHLTWDNRLAGADISVGISGGEVHLGGTVTSYAARQTAEDDVRGIPGVTAVRNELAVKYPAEARTPGDRQIEDNLRSLLNFTAELDEHKITVSVVNGTVMLDGAVDSFWKKVRAEGLAASVSGVLAIHNNLTVVPTRDVLDEVIAQDISAAMGRSTSIDLDQMNIEVNNGEVTLSGSVPDRIAFRLAEETAQCTAGTRKVTNDLVIERSRQD